MFSSSTRFFPIAALLAVAVFTSSCGTGQEAQAQAPAFPPAVVAIAEPMVKEIVTWDEFTGRFQPVDRVEIRARVSGYLEEIRFEDGEIVEKGDVLFIIDQRPFRIALAQAQADLDQARSQVTLAEKEYERVAGLRKSRAVSAEELDRRTQELAVARARVTALAAGVEDAELNLSFTEVRAPISGRVSERKVTLGNLISGGSAGSTLLTTVVSLDPIYFYIEASEGDLLKYARVDPMGVGPGVRQRRTPIHVQLMDEADFGHRGHIDFIDNEIDPSTGTVTVRGVFQNPNHLLKAGLFGRARLVGSAPFQAVMVPDTAIVTSLGRKVVYTLNQEQIVTPRPVELGTLYEGDLRVIRAGLEPGEKIIVTGLAKIRPGMPVQPEEKTIEELRQQAGAGPAPGS